MMALNLCIWIFAAFFFAYIFKGLGEPRPVVFRIFLISLNTGLVTAVMSFFLLKHVSQRHISRFFFPEGGLYNTSKTIRIRIFIRFLALLFACNIIPLLSFIQLSYLSEPGLQDTGVVLQGMRTAILTNSMPGSFADIISDVNRQLVRDVEDSGQFVTMFYLTVDPIKKHLQYVRAGHDPAIFYDPGTDSFEELGGSGIALGVNEDWNYKEYTKTALNRGQIIFLSTDGIWEAFNEKGEMFGKERIYDIIRNNSSLSANEILDASFGISKMGGFELIFHD